MKKKNTLPYITFKDYENEHFTKEEIELFRLKTELFGILNNIKKEKDMTQKDLEKASGVSQPVISRLMNHKADSNITTLLKVLMPLGYTVKIVPLKNEDS